MQPIEMPLTVAAVGTAVVDALRTCFRRIGIEHKQFEGRQAAGGAVMSDSGAWQAILLKSLTSSSLQPVFDITILSKETKLVSSLADATCPYIT